MPYEARINMETEATIMAGDVTRDEQHNTFYCITPNCKAEMTLVNMGNIEEAYFRRKPSSPAHISAKCVRCGIRFDRTRYDETKFTTKGLFDWVLSQPTESHKGKTGTKTGKRGGKTLGFRSLGNIYRLCASMDKSDIYNGVTIGDIFADYENATRYINNLEGNLIVEVTYYCKLHNELALLFNYPSDFKTTHNIVRVDFQNTKSFWDYYKILNRSRKSKHTEPIVIAGVWKKIENNPNYQAQCTIISTRQIYFPK